ncbi:MAG: hypothetical protein BGP13_00095 [Sphingobacteriales bacterium 40-81]|nr:MAG: hypothetical protein BGP13_00095 [Sphingobacteriales bacterium 40-81]
MIRRRQKYIIKYAALGGIATAVADVFLQWNELKSKGLDITWDNFDGKRTFKRGLIGGGIGAFYGYKSYIDKLDYEARFPFNGDEYLRRLLAKENITSDPMLLKTCLKYKYFLKDWLANKFNKDLAGTPEDAGSFFKYTAIKSNFDFDIILPFKRTSYLSLQDMFYNVYDTINKELDEKAFISKQTKGIGITFERHGSPIHFDVIPGREISDYQMDKKLNLYVRPDWAWQKGSSFKTNVQLQKRITQNMPQVRKAIKLIKLYRDRNGLNIPSVLIEQCVCEALSQEMYKVSFSCMENFLNGMLHLSNRMRQEKFVDFINTNNNLLEKMPDYDKSHISEQLRRDIAKVENNPRYLEELFDL